MKYLRALKVTLSCWRRIFREYRIIGFRPWYLEELLNGRYALNNPTMVTTLNLGNKNPSRTIAYILLDRGWVPTAGFFALMNRTLCALYFADKMGFTPVISNWDGCAYEEEDAVFGTKNVFEYYFKQPSDCSVKEALHSKTVVIPSNKNMDIVLNTYKSEWYHLSNEYLNEMGRIYGKYINFNERTNNSIKKDIKKTIGGKKTLAIHYRGSDYRINANGHPISLTLDDYYKEIDRALEEKKFEQIFVATDDILALKELKERYNCITFFEDVMRTDKDVSVAFLDNERKQHKYKLGYEVLRDAYALSCCDGLIAGHSQVAIGARIMKASRKEKYRYFKIIEKGVNHNNIEWMKIYDKSIKNRVNKN